MASRNLLLAGIAVTLLAVAACHPSPSALSSLSAQSVSAGQLSFPAVRISVTTSPVEAPRLPARGAYFGAWVGPDVFTQANEVKAVDRLQQQIGRKLAVVHTYLKWRAPFPTASDRAFLAQGSMLLISWAGTDVGQITSGADDALIRARAAQVKALGHPVFLEWRWEMDRPNLRSQVHSAAGYIAAWDHIRAIFASVEVRNAAWVWCPTAAGFADGSAAAFYPGDTEVDWICADAYPYGSSVSFAATVNPFLKWAARRGKPVMIGEYGVPESVSGSLRARWLRAMAGVVHADRQVKAVLYFDADSPGQIPYALRGTALSAFRSIARQPYFNPAGDH